MKLSGKDKKRLQSALLSAFPKQSALEQLTAFHLSTPLDSVAQGPDLTAVVFRLIEWAESNGRIKDLVDGAKSEKPGNELLKQFTISAEGDSVSTIGRVTWRHLVFGGVGALFLALIALALVSKPTKVEASITTTRAVLGYRPNRLDEGRNDSPLLDGVHATNLDVSWFDGIEIQGGRLFREARKGTWVPVESSLPIRIRSTHDDARATFTDVWVHQLKVPEFPEIYVSAIETMGVGIEFVVESEIGTNETSVLTVEYVSDDGIAFTCSRCSIDSGVLETDRQVQDTQVLRIAGSADKRLSIEGRPRRIEIELIPATGALSREQFPVETARFCEGQPSDPQALQSATLTFTETRKEEKMLNDRRRSAMTLALEDDVFLVKGFRVLRGDGPRPPAFAFDISGQAKDIRVGPSCKESTSILPSRLSHLLGQLIGTVSDQR